MSSDIFDIQALDILADSAREESKEKTENIDYKMVTFSLGGKDYGIDIMKVKEISKASKFTYVPNSIPFVKGVYNLRGDIISVIDLRIMFNLPVPENHGGVENMIILRLEDNTLGIIVDSIDKVVGISSQRIQPPHPLFGDINIKFIKGIVENDSKLYIILDVESVFDQKAAEASLNNVNTVKAVQSYKADSGTDIPKVSAGVDVDYSFIVETLETLGGFTVSSINEPWVKNRFQQWKKERADAGFDVQLNNGSDAEKFLAGFNSAYTGVFWERDYIENVKKLLPDVSGGVMNVWNIGCGKGEETYSFAVACRERYSEKRIKIYAHDKDLLNISTAPNLVFTRDAVPGIYSEYIADGKNGWQFNSEIKDLILFEYHDVTHDNQMPPMDIILVRDVLSFLSREEQGKLISIFDETLKTGGLLIVGANETIRGDNWEPVKGSTSAYRKR